MHMVCAYQWTPPPPPRSPALPILTRIWKPGLAQAVTVQSSPQPKDFHWLKADEEVGLMGKLKGKNSVIRDWHFPHFKMSNKYTTSMSQGLFSSLTQTDNTQTDRGTERLGSWFHPFLAIWLGTCHSILGAFSLSHQMGS